MDFGWAVGDGRIDSVGVDSVGIVAVGVGIEVERFAVVDHVG